MDICARTRACARKGPERSRSAAATRYSSRAPRSRAAPGPIVGRPSFAGRQQVTQGAHGCAAVAEPILLVEIELRHGGAELGEPEVWVIAEAARTARRIENAALPRAFGNQRRRVVGAGDVGQHTSIARAALLGGNARESAVEFRIVGVVVGAEPRKARGENPRGTAERVDFEPRIVRNGGAALRRGTVKPGDGCGGGCRSRRGVSRLQEGILEKARAGLLGRSDAELAQAANIEGQVRQQRAEFEKLARVAGCDYERPTRHVH